MPDYFMPIQTIDLNTQHMLFKINTIEPGRKYFWCSCGLSLKQPWCDGSHKPTQFKPIQWIAPSNVNTGGSVYAFCQCKQTKTAPLCDGTHKSIRPIIEQRQTNCPSCHDSKFNAEQCTKKISLPDGKRLFCQQCGSVVDSS
ncbi:unnamed protein product [Schistosoma turkestanicum]|nr:unnamed protein product [Schistosoma turkestanicum]